MKAKQFIFLVMFGLLYSSGFAQDTLRYKPTESAHVKIGLPSPYYVLQVGEKSVGIDPKEDDKFDLKSINPEGIKEIHVLKGADAINKYGDNGTNGVVIISFKESYILPRDLQERFNDSK